MKLKIGWWHTAYRQKPQGTILSDTDTPFCVIPNTPLLCAMDPFIFKYKETTYIFAEVYSLVHNRGLIGYTRFNGKRFTKWKPVIKEPYHLSYPYLIERDGNIYMIPESFQSGQVYAYKAVEFPDKWEKVFVLKDDVKYVDTSFVSENGEDYAFTYDMEGQAPHRLLLYQLKNGKMEDAYCHVLSDDDSVARPGGYPFDYQGERIRVSQDCDGEYGKAVVFSRLSPNIWENYHEEVVLRFGIEDLHLNKNLDVKGIHTYTATDEFEVIDLKGVIFHPLRLFFQLILKIKRVCFKERRK